MHSFTDHSNTPRLCTINKQLKLRGKKKKQLADFRKKRERKKFCLQFRQTQTDDKC